MFEDENRIDIVEVLTAQHQEVSALLTKIKQARRSDRSASFHTLAGKLDVHEAAEESVVYPVLRDMGPDETSVVDRRMAEEAAAKDVLGQLNEHDPASDEFDRMFLVFSKKVAAHARSEETEVFALLSKLSEERRELLAVKFLRTQTDAMAS